MGSHPSHRPHLSRRHFLLTASAGTATAAVVAAARQAGVPEGARLTGATTPVTTTRTLHVDEHPMFVAAARDHDVPAALLAALSHAQTRWHDHDGRPSAALGYGPMHLIDGAALAAKRALVGKTDPPEVVDTLGQAVRASGLPVEAVRSDPAANIAAAAALLAATQRAAGRPVGRRTNPADWYQTVAETSGLTRARAQLELADTVLDLLRDGASLGLPDGSVAHLRAQLTARPTAAQAAQRERIEKRARTARRQRRDPHIEAPPGLEVEWVPAPYEHYGSGASDYGNHDLARRPSAPTITHIVIHDTEGYWDSVLHAVQDPTYVSWQYTVRSHDGLIAQHVQAKDVCWHAGNWWMNMHAIGIEHEGFAASGGAWYSEPMYRRSARLVAYLAAKYDIPLDRAHIIGHDQVPGTTTETIPSMHWDPGPFWDWEHYFDLLGAPLENGCLPASKRPGRGHVVRILPGFTGNGQTVTGCEHSGRMCSEHHDTNFVTLHTAPSGRSSLVTDRGQHQGSRPTTEVSDIGARATAGTEFVVAELRGDWTGVWFLDTVAWFYNPRSRPTARVVAHTLGRVRAPKGRPARVFGRCYPEAAAYPRGTSPQDVEPLIYTLPPGHMYVVTDDAPDTDYYKATRYSTRVRGDHVDIKGRTKYLQISLGHRVGYVLRSEVEDVELQAPDTSPSPGPSPSRSSHRRRRRTRRRS